MDKQGGYQSYELVIRFFILNAPKINVEIHFKSDIDELTYLLYNIKKVIMSETQLKKRYKIYTIFLSLTISVLCVIFVLSIIGVQKYIQVIFCLMVAFNVLIWSWKVFIKKTRLYYKKHNIVLMDHDINQFIKYLLGPKMGQKVVESWIMQRKDS